MQTGEKSPEPDLLASIRPFPPEPKMWYIHRPGSTGFPPACQHSSQTGANISLAASRAPPSWTRTYFGPNVVFSTGGAKNSLSRVGVWRLRATKMAAGQLLQVQRNVTSYLQRKCLYFCPCSLHDPRRMIVAAFIRQPGAHHGST